MKISIIVAMGLERQIGREGKIPWHLSWDLKNFKKITMGHHLVVGRKTFQSIGHALPGRQMIVVSRNADFSAPGCTTAPSLTVAIQMAQEKGEKELFIAGGCEIYAEAIPLAQKLYITQVDYIGEADRYFPPMSLDNWERTFSNFSPSQGDEPSAQFEIWEKITDP